jgi:hypothetical protein
MERERFFKTINAGINTAAALLARDWHRWASMLRRLEDCWFEIWVFKEPHVRRIASLRCGLGQFAMACDATVR